MSDCPHSGSARVRIHLRESNLLYELRVAVQLDSMTSSTAPVKKGFEFSRAHPTGSKNKSTMRALGAHVCLASPENATEPLGSRRKADSYCNHDIRCPTCLS